MTVEETLAALGLETYAEALAPQWEESQRALPAGDLPFLAPSFVREACRACSVSEEITEATVRTAARVAECEALRALVWHLHRAVYANRGAQWGSTSRWPRELRPALGEEAACFYLLLALSNFAGMQAEHRAHDVPADVVHATLQDVALWLETTRARTGEAIPNLGPMLLPWFSSHFRGRLYRLGRLQFQFGNSGYALHVFRHRETRAVVALSGEGQPFTAAGQRACDEAPADGWTSQFSLTEAGAVGNPILPTGRALRQEVTLPATEWEQVLAPGDPVLHLHIPGGEPMTHADCGESFRRAMEFFPRHYPDYHYRAFVCGSWILNSWLAEVLPPESNLVRFQREVYLFPIELWVPAMYDRVFGAEELPQDLSQLPRKTGLQRIIVDALESGRGVGAGAGGLFLFPEDFDWGAEVYRKQRGPLEGLGVKG